MTHKSFDITQIYHVQISLFTKQGVSKNVSPSNCLEYFHFGEVILHEIVQICWQFISTYIYPFL